jgi:tetratricopeptide (TPR) repeat protein
MSVSAPTSDPSLAGASVSRIDEPRLIELRAELEAREDKLGKAVIADAIGRLLLRDPAHEGAAARELLASYNHEPTFRPPLYALVDSFERKRSFKNLGRLYDAEHKSATDAAGRSDALLDRAMFLLATGGAMEEVDALIDQAIEPRPERASAWAIVELLARHRGRDALAGEAAAARARAARSPRLRAALLHESAVASADAAAALDLLVQASEADPSSTRIQTALDGAAREAGRFAAVVDALERRAEAEPNDLEAAALFCEASALARARLLDLERAMHASERAVARAPEDLLVWIERAETAEAAEAWGVLEAACEKVLALISDDDGGGALAAVVHYRRAEAATNQGRGEDAARHLAAARALAPSSHVLAAMADSSQRDLLEARTEELESRLRSEGASVETRLEALRELAGIAAAWSRRDALDERVGAFAALATSESAVGEGARVPGDVWRDLALLAISVGARGALATLAPHLLEGLASDDASRADERAAWRLTALHLACNDKSASERRVALAAEALADPACAGWAPEVARVLASRAGDHALVARAHDALASAATAGEIVAAHRAAQARALVRGGDLEAAQAVLARALEASSSDAYARALLEDVGRARGDVEAVLRTLREAASGDQPDAIAAQLSATAHVAEIEGNVALAVRSAEEALAARPDAADVLHLRARLALRSTEGGSTEGGSTQEGSADVSRGDIARADEARAGLSPVWRLLSALRAPASEARSAALRALVAEGSVDVEAALALAVAPGANDPAREAARARLGDAFALPADPLEGVRTGRAGAWLELADELMNEDGAGNTADGLASHALRVALLRGEMDDDAFLRVAELENLDNDVRPDPALVSSEVIFDAMLRGESSDMSELAAAHARHVARGAAEDVLAMHDRWAVAAGRGDQVVAGLAARVTERPDDVASLDALRVAAREARSWPEVVRACDGLAAHVTGELQAQLLEEAAAVLMDEIDDVEGAEDRCRRALAIDRQRDIAYARLHDLLAERGDDAGLLDLVNARSEVFDDPEILAPLLYEQARLFRGLGQVDEALASLDNLLLLEDEHVGGLALQVEIHVQREAFDDAVDSLRALASAKSAPMSQRRIARLGAAEFLEKKLGDAAGALAELSLIETDLKMADRVVYERMASLAERSGRLEDAARAHVEAASRANDPLKRAAAYRKLGELARRQGRLEDAATAYRQALDAQPDDVDAAEALAEIPVAGDAEERVQAVSVALRAGAFPLTIDHLTRVERVARLAGDWGLSAATQELLRTLEGAPSGAPPLELPQLRSVDEARLAIVPRLSRDAAFELAQLVCEVLGEVEPLEPSAFGAASKDLKARGAGELGADVVHAITTQLGAGGDVFVAGDGKTIVGGASRGKPFYVIGRGARSPQTIAYDAAFFATGVRTELAALAVRCARGGASSVSTAIFATAAAAGAPIQGADTRDGFAELARSLAKPAAKRQKRVAELVAAVGDGKAVTAWSRELHARLVRMAVLVSSDLARGLGALTGSSAKPEAIAASEAATALAREWLKSDVIAARAAFGWRPPD